MNENIIPFPSPENSESVVGKLNHLELSVRNLFDQTADQNRELNSRESIAAVQTEAQQISEKISQTISELDGLQPDLLPVDEFASKAWAMLCIPLEYGEGRAAISYYGVEDEYHKLVSLYKSQINQLQQGGLANL